MNNHGLYIYGIINSSTRELGGQDPAGGNGLAVFLVPFRELAAVVSEEAIVDLTHLPKDVLARRLVDHQRVIEGVMGLKHTIIPMKLGTFAGDPAEVREILTRGYKTVTDIFHTINDKLEMDVAVTWIDLAAVLKLIGEEPEIREAKQKLLANPHKITVDDQMRVGLMVKKSLDARREQTELKIRAALSAISRDLRVHELMDDRMVTNTAFLIARERQAEFEQCLDRLNAETGETLHFRCVGPLPPYSFCTLEVERLHYEDIEWARTKLGLPDRATKAEVKMARQTQAVLVHPDKHPDTPGLTTAFDEVTQASQIIAEYGMALEQAGVLDGWSFREPDVQRNALLVKVRG